MVSKRYPETSCHSYNITSPDNPQVLHQRNYEFEYVQVCRCAGIEGDVMYGK